MQVANILKAKGTDILSVTPDTQVIEVAKILKAKRIGALLVLEGDTIAGIISERDIARALPDYGEKLLSMTVSELMTKTVTTCSSDASIDEIMEMMTNNRIRHLPVVDDGKLIGFISVGDVVKYRVDELVAEEDQLRSYVSGSNY
ncbi:MAG: CBS domain-containing protein [Rhodospirillaceae bacterium]|jgi:CBS domain-containing protein